MSNDDLELEGVCWTIGSDLKPVPGKHKLTAMWQPWDNGVEPYQMHICLRCKSPVYVIDVERFRRLQVKP